MKTAAGFLILVSALSNYWLHFIMSGGIYITQGMHVYDAPNS